MAYNLDKVSSSLSDISKLQTGVLGNFVEITKTSSATGQAWIAIGRFFSGTGFWKIQNKVKAISNILQFQVKMQEKRLKVETELTDEVAKLDGNLQTVLKTRAGIERILDGTADHEERLSLMGSKYFKVLKARHGTIGALHKLKERTIEGEKKSLKFAEELYKHRAKDVKQHLRKIKNLEDEAGLVRKLYKTKDEQDARSIKITEELAKLNKGMLITQNNNVEMSEKQLGIAARIMDTSQEQVMLEKELADLRAGGSKEDLELAEKVDKKVQALRETRFDLEKDLKEGGIETKKSGTGAVTGFDSSNVKKDTGGFKQKTLKLLKLDGVWKKWQKRHLLKKWFWEKKNAAYNKLTMNGKQGILSGLGKFIQKGLLLMLQVFLIIGLLILALVIFKAMGGFEWIKQFFSLIEDVVSRVWDTLIEVFMVVGEFVGAIFNFVGALFDPNGDAWGAGIELLGKTGELLMVLLKLAWEVVGGMLVIAFGLVVTFFTGMWAKIRDGPLGTVGATVITAIVGLFAVWLVVSWLQTFAGASLIVAVIVASIAALASFFDWFADGGTVSSGMQIVGEKGPELVSLPSGSRVHSNSASKNLVGGGTNNITVNVQGRIGASDAELRDIAAKVGRMISTEINRSTSTGSRA